MKPETKIVLILCLIATLTACTVKKKSLEPVQNAVTYTTTVKPIIDTNCISCHSGNTPAADIDFSTYESVRFQTEKGELLQRINNANNPMPMSGLMSLDKRKALKQWAQQGYPYGKENTTAMITPLPKFLPTTITAVSSTEGFDFFNQMQGHWVGNIFILGQTYDWFAFDYRAIAPSHVHGIYEGGTMGNLFTSFFIANLNGTHTIMARNGGILNGIYRTSYFVLDTVKRTDESTYYRFVDAYGGTAIMYMELEFTGNTLSFNSYTSRFGSTGAPKLHMKFNATKTNTEVSAAVAEALGYPKQEVAIDFSNGLPYPNWGTVYPEITSASYIHQDKGEDLLTLSKLSGDPYTIADMPQLAQLKVELTQNEAIKDKPLLIYLSKQSLTDGNGKLIMEGGYVKQNLFNGVFSFPELIPNQTEYTFTYLHPGHYYITVVADVDGSGVASKGDITCQSKLIVVLPNKAQTMIIEAIEVQN